MEAFNNFDELALYLCGFCAGRYPLSDLIRHLTDHHINRQHTDRHLHFLWCKLCSLPQDTQQTRNCFQSGMREVSNRTYLPAGVYYNPSTNFWCATNEWHNDAYYGYGITPINEYNTNVPMYGYSVDSTGVLQVSNMQSNFYGIPFQATTHVNYHLPMLNYVAPHVDIANAESPLEAVSNEVQRVGEIPNAESPSEVTNGEMPTRDPACAESRSEVTNGEMPTRDPACAESRSDVTNGEIPTKDSALDESLSDVTNGEMLSPDSAFDESRSDVTNGEMQIVHPACIESPSEATKQEKPHVEDTTTCAESPSEATNEKRPTIKDPAYSELRSDATNEMSCVVVTCIVSQSVASNDVPHVNCTHVEPPTVVVKPEIVSKYKDDRHVVAGLNGFRFSESDNTAIQKNLKSNLPQVRNYTISREGSHYNHSNSQDERGRGSNVSSNRNSSGSNRNGYRNSHRGGNNHNFNNTRGMRGYQNRNDHMSLRNHNSRRGGHRSTEYNSSDNYLNHQRNKNNLENGSNQRNGRSNYDSSTVANKSRGGGRNNGLNGTHGCENEQNGRFRENVKFSSGTSKGSYSDVVKRRLQIR